MCLFWGSCHCPNIKNGPSNYIYQYHFFQFYCHLYWLIRAQLVTENKLGIFARFHWLLGKEGYRIWWQCAQYIFQLNPGTYLHDELKEEFLDATVDNSSKSWIVEQRAATRQPSVKVYQLGISVLVITTRYLGNVRVWVLDTTVFDITIYYARQLVRSSHKYEIMNKVP